MSDARIRGKLAEAIRAGARRDYPAAVELLEDVLARSDDLPEALLYLGRARHALGEYGRAIAAFIDYLEARPSSAQARLFLGRSYVAAGLPRRALVPLSQAARMRPEDASIAAMHGLACLKARRSAAAVAELERAVKLAPEDARIYRGYLSALLVRGIRLARSGGDDRLAEQMLRFVVENGADGVLPRLELAKLYRDAGAPEAALAQYDRAVELAPEDPQLRWYRASALMALDRSDAAGEELESLKALGADVPSLSWNAELVDRFMIRSFLSSGEWRKAAAACSTFLKRRGDDVSMHAMYAEALRGQGEFESAENHARRAIAKAPGEAALRYGLLLVLWEKGDWKALKTELSAARRLGCDADAVLRFTALLASKLDPNDKAVVSLIQEAIRKTGPAPELMFALASRYLKLGLADLAASWYRKTLGVEPSHEEAALGLIAALEAMEADGQAETDSLVEAYRAYLSRFSDNRPIAREYTLLLVKRGRFAEATEPLETLLAAESSNRTLRRLLAYAYRRNDRYREAVVLLKALLKERPKDEGLLLELAHCLDKAGASKYAMELLEKAKAHFAATASASLALGILYAKAGKKERALECCREAAAKAPNDPRPLRRMEALYRKSGIAEYADRYADAAAKLEKRNR